MATYHARARTGGLGLASMAFGILGLVCYWWYPAGTILGLAGLLIGILGWVLTPPRAGNLGFMVVGTLLSLAALALNLWIGFNGLETVRFTALR
jgi:hypothetical protein